MTAAYLSFAFVVAGWLTFVAAIIVIAASDRRQPGETLWS